MGLYKKDLYLDKTIPYLISKEIIEYDISSAGYSISKEFKLLSQSRLRYLETLDKTARQIAIGLYQKNDSSYKDALKEKFIEVRKMFFEANKLDDDDVLSIKKDAIVCLRRCDRCVFGDIRFVDKNVYTSFFNFNNLEFYLGRDTLDVKGISDEKLKLHKDYMLDFLFRILKMFEISSRRQLITNIKEFSDYYKSKQLMIGYYRELNKDSLYKLEKTLQGALVGLLNSESIDGIDISYNYMNYIVPLLNILL